jgi:hypothetical protein
LGEGKLSEHHLRTRTIKGLTPIVILLILSLVLFYFGFTVGYDYVKSYNDVINVNSANGNLIHYEFGDYYQFYPYSARYIAEFPMQPGDYITTSYRTPTSFNGTVYIVLWLSAGGPVVIPWMNDTILEYRNSTTLKYTFTGSLNYGNNTYHLEEISIALDVATQNLQNSTISLTTTLHNYRTPQWILLGAATMVGVAVIVLSFSARARFSRECQMIQTKFL